MDIENRIKKIKDYFIEMKVESYSDSEGKEGKMIYVISTFPHSWILSQDTLEKFNVQCEPDEESPDRYYFWTDFESGFEPIFDAIEYNIENNMIAQEKTEIFKEKLNELKLIFEDEALSVPELKSLTITYKKKKERAKKDKKKEIIVESTQNEENNNISNINEDDEITDDTML